MKNNSYALFTKRLDRCKEILVEKGLEVIDWCNFSFLVKNIHGAKNWVPDYYVLWDIIPEYVFEEGSLRR